MAEVRRYRNNALVKPFLRKFEPCTFRTASFFCEKSRVAFLHWPPWATTNLVVVGMVIESPATMLSRVSSTLQPKSAALGPTREAPGLVVDSMSHPADIFLPTRHQGRPAALDVHIISLLQQQLGHEAASTPGYALEVGTQRKLTSHPCPMPWCWGGVHPSGSRDAGKPFWRHNSGHQLLGNCHLPTYKLFRSVQPQPPIPSSGCCLVEG